VNEAASDTVAAGSVISQAPAAGALVAPSSLVSLTVSSGPQNAGCTCPSSGKGAFSLDGIAKMLGDLFMVGLALITLQQISKNK